jgi:ribosomal protein S18 acetylase RimI-like enzyme
MPETRGEPLNYRPAGAADAEAVAGLHAGSWRRHYRGAYSDAFLDGDVLENRLAVWRRRLGEPDPNTCTILAEDDGLVGFAATIFDENPDWGALINNLHVAPSHQRRGIGRRLLELTAEALLQRPVLTGMYLWALEQNADARAFYERCRGEQSGRTLVPAPGGIASRLAGVPAMVRYTWPEPVVLLS